MSQATPGKFMGVGGLEGGRMLWYDGHVWTCGVRVGGVLQVKGLEGGGACLVCARGSPRDGSLVARGRTVGSGELGSVRGDWNAGRRQDVGCPLVGRVRRQEG